METIQAFLPARQSSSSDLVANAAGGSLGALVAYFQNTPPRSVAGFWRNLKARSNQGAATTSAFVAFSVWVCSQWVPFVPTLDVSAVRQGFSPMYRTLVHGRAFDYYNFADHAFTLLGLMLVLSSVFRTEKEQRSYVPAAFAVVLCVKPFIVTRSLSAEMAAAFVSAGLVFLIIPGPRARTVTGLISILVGYCVSELTPGVGPFHAFNWVPLEGQLTSVLTGLQGMLESVVPFLGVAAGVQYLFNPRPAGRTIIAGTFLLCAFTFTLETLQKLIPGRYPDVTTILLTGAGWLIPWLWYEAHGAKAAEQQSASAESSSL